MRNFYFVLEEEIDGELYQIRHMIDVPYIMAHYRGRSDLLLIEILRKMNDDLTEEQHRISSGKPPDDTEKQQ